MRAAEMGLTMNGTGCVLFHHMHQRDARIKHFRKESFNDFFKTLFTATPQEMVEEALPAAPEPVNVSAVVERFQQALARAHVEGMVKLEKRISVAVAKLETLQRELEDEEAAVAGLLLS